MAKLQGARLIGTDLTLARLERADLTFAFAREAKLSGANLSGANLTEANLYDANLKNVDFTEAYISGAYLNGANIEGAIGLPNVGEIDLPDAKDERIAELEAKLAEYQNEKAGTVVIKSSNGEATISFNIEESEDLKNWQETDKQITTTIQLRDGKKFYRFALDK